MFRLEVSEAIIKVAKKKRKKKRPDRKLEADVLKAVLLSTAPLPVASAASIIAHRASTGKNKALFRKVVDEAKRRGYIVRPWPKQTFFQKLKNRFQEGAHATAPDMSESFKKFPGSEKNIRIFHPEEVSAGEISGKRMIWTPSNESPGLTAHEMGHAEQRVPSGWVEKLLDITGPVGLLGGILGSKRAKTPEEAQRAALVGTGLAAIPGMAMLGREAGAHIRGLRTLKRLGATRGQMLGAGLTEMLPSFLSTAAQGSVLPLATYLTSRAVAPRPKKKEKK
jgi:hypothetical protein